MRALVLLLAAGGLLTACGQAGDRTDRAFSASGEVIAMGGGAGGPANACFSCHGLDGAGDGVSTPRLAGLDAGYLHKQMEDYASGVRRDPVMTPVAQGLDHAGRRRVAAYYAGMAAPSAVAGASGAAPEAWRQAHPHRNLPACAACHGAEGQGLGPGYPAVAAQPAAYTADQLARWARADRRNDPRGVMRTAVAELSPAEIQAIADWLAGRPASPAPERAGSRPSDAASAAERPAASRAGHRRDPRSGV